MRELRRTTCPECSVGRRPGVRRLAAMLTTLAIVCLGNAGASASGGGTAASDDLLDFFDQIALRQQTPIIGVRPRWVRRWTGPVSVTLSGQPPAGFRAALTRSLTTISRWTGRRFTLVAHAGWGARLQIRIVPHAEMRARYGPEGHVCTAITYGRGGRLRLGRIEISDRYTDCLDHELMHALGFDGHWHARSTRTTMRSVLALRYAPGRAFRFTRYDEMAIRALYHPQLVSGMPRDNALARIRRFLRSHPKL